MKPYSSHTKGRHADRQLSQDRHGDMNPSINRSAVASIDRIYTLIDSGQTEEALELCRQMLSIQPDHVELLFVLANLQQTLGHSESAVSTYRRILELEPGLVEAAYNLGLLHQQLGADEQAERCYRQALVHAPRFAAAHNNLGALLLDRGNRQEAADCFEMVTRIEPNNVDGHFNAGRCLFELGRFDEAAAYFEIVARLRPDLAKGWHNLGLCYQKLDQHARALQYLKTALDLSPQNSNLYFDIGNVFLDMGDTASVIAWYRTGVTHCPENKGRLENLAMLLQEQGHFEDAIDYFRQIIRLDPDHILAHFNLSLLLLRLGRYEEGWREYEWRLEKPDWSKGYPWQHKKPRWQGEEFKGKTLLVHCEQGYGDSLQFVRYLPLVKSRGGRVILEAPGPLLEVFRSIPGVDQLRCLTAQSSPDDNFDLYTPLLSLPGIFNTVPESIPCEIPYLYANTGKASLWRNQAATGYGRIGIVWAGSKVHVNDRRRSCSLEHFGPLTRIPGLQFYSLQTEVSDDQIASRGLSGRVVHWGDRFRDFSDTAAAISNLDLIITVDTAVAHLAGAMGKPVWLLLPFVADWRWSIDGANSPWYPSMRLFRQTTPDDWSNVFQEVEAALQHFTCNPYKTHTGG